MGDSRRLLQVADDLRAEIESLDRIVAEAARCIAEFGGREPRPLEVRGAGDIVHDFYNAVERFFERVAAELNGGLPAGPDSHATLLGRMAREVGGVRPAVVTPEVRKRLEEYLRFRHFFRHRYGFELEWAKLEPLLRGVGELAPAVRRDLDGFASAVRELAARVERD